MNTASFVAVIAVVVAWRGVRMANALPREHVGEATRAGARYVRESPALRAVLVRTVLFAFLASSIWALLPLTARSQLHLGSGGYGLLLGCVGIGALGGAALLPRFRVMLPAGTLVTIGSLALGCVTLVLAYAHVAAFAALALVVGGIAWILVLSTFNSVYQLTLPAWVKTRGLAFYLIAFQGGMAVGSAAAGLAAQQAGLSRTLAAASAGLLLGPLAALRYKFQAITPDDLLPAGDWPAPHLVTADGADATDGADAPAGPVMVNVEYCPRPGLEQQFLAELEAARHSRRRTGAISWRIWRDAENPQRFVEQFVVASWQDHLRQHERVSQRDQARLDHIVELTDPAYPPVVTHWLAPDREPRALISCPR